MVNIKLNGDKQIILSFNNSDSCNYWLKRIRNDMKEGDCNLIEYETDKREETLT